MIHWIVSPYSTAWTREHFIFQVVRDLIFSTSGEIFRSKFFFWLCSFYILRRSSVDNHVQTMWNTTRTSAIDTRTWLCKGSTRALSPWLGLASITFFIDFLASWMLNWCIDAQHIDKRMKRREENSFDFPFFLFYLRTRIVQMWKWFSWFMIAETTIVALVLTW